jgi:AcrR family transcriptional regulator
MNKKVEKGLETRREIVEAAKRLFAEQGYGGVSIEEVLVACQISRGALYHHFRSKEALFEAVVEAVETELATHVVARSATAADPVSGLIAGAEAFLDLAREPAVRQIVLIDAPAALGWEKWREIDGRHGFGLLKAALAPAAAQAGLPAAMVDAFAHMLLASLSEVAFLIARADDAEAAIADGKAAIRELIARLLGPPRGP